MDNKCLICNSNTNSLFQTKVLSKYDVGFHKCTSCGFIQTDTPYWLEEAYSSAIISTDIGLINRNLLYSQATENILKLTLNCSGKFLDFAGGFGIFVRIMRDKGFDFYWDDIYCDNIFAQYFTIDQAGSDTKFEAVTSFEVFEHVPNPLEEVEKLFKYSDTIIFSTELVPNIDIKSEKDWWYFVPEGGQHISFYTKKSFEVICEKFNCHFYTNGRDLHILTKKKLRVDPLVEKATLGDKVANKIIRALNKTKTNYIPDVSLKSKTLPDALYIRELENKKNDINHNH